MVFNIYTFFGREMRKIMKNEKSTMILLPNMESRMKNVDTVEASHAAVSLMKMMMK